VIPDPDTNTELSRRRARAVAAELEHWGVPVEQATGMGALLPVASNDTSSGRDRNRRVELWVR